MQSYYRHAHGDIENNFSASLQSMHFTVFSLESQNTVKVLVLKSSHVLELSLGESLKKSNAPNSQGLIFKIKYGMLQENVLILALENEEMNSTFGKQPYSPFLLYDNHTYLHSYFHLRTMTILMCTGLFLLATEAPAL